MEKYGRRKGYVFRGGTTNNRALIARLSGSNSILDKLLEMFPPVKTLLITIVLFILFLGIYTTVVTIRFFLDRSEIIDQVYLEKDWLYGVAEHKPKPVIRILARDGELIGELLPERDTRVTMNACQEMAWLRRAAVAAEDRYFYDHAGISLRGVLRAFVRNLVSFSIREGAGSITMQLARNLFTDRSQTLYRKIYETWTAFQLESMLTKDEILCLYLNKIYMGEGRIGAAEASWYYFRKPPEKLKPAEAAMIVGLFPSPVRYSPQNDILKSLKKQKIVLETLVRDGWLREFDIQPMIDDFIERYEIHVDEQNPHPGTVGAYGASRDYRLHHPAPAANEYVRQFLFENLDEEIIRAGGLTVHTSIDRFKQAAALRAVRTVVEDIRGKMLKTSNLDEKEKRKIISRLNGVMVSLDPSTGDILAVVGGYGVTESGNMTGRIWKMLRQPGSTIKGFLYALAIDRGLIDVDSTVVDEALDFNGYSPGNWYEGYKGEISFREAVAVSSNTIAVKVLNDLGIDYFRNSLGKALEMGYFETMRRFRNTLTLSLGSGEVTPLELARLYGSLLNEGYVVRPRLIMKVEDADGNVYWDATEPSISSTRIISGEAAARAIHVLRSVLENEEGTAYWIGKRFKNKSKNYSIAGKSGTVQTVEQVRKKFPGFHGIHDAWYVGLIPGEVDVVWIGQDEGAPFPGSGSGSAGSVWAFYADLAFGDKEGLKFPYQDYLETIHDFDPSPSEDDESFFNFF